MPSPWCQFKPTSASFEAFACLLPSVTGRERHVARAPRHRPRPFPHPARPGAAPCRRRRSGTCRPLPSVREALLSPFLLSRASFRLSGWHDAFFYTFRVAVYPPHMQLLFLKASQACDSGDFKAVRGGGGVFHLHRHPATTLRAQASSLSFVTLPTHWFTARCIWQ